MSDSLCKDVCNDDGEEGASATHTPTHFNTFAQNLHNFFLI